MRVVSHLALAVGSVFLVACANGNSKTTTFDSTAYSCPLPEPIYSEIRELVPARNGKGRKNARYAKATTVDAMTVYPWVDGQVYPIAVQAGRMTTVRLWPGESVPGQIAWLDHENFKVGKTQYGTEQGPITTLVLRAVKPGVETPMFVATDKRGIQLRVVSYSKPAMDMVRWGPPPDSEFGFEDLSPQLSKGVMTAALGGPGIDPTTVNRSYDVLVKSGNPRWTPISVADYGGSQVYIEFPDGLGNLSRPALYDVIDGDLRGSIPYSAQGRFYRTHRSFSEAELRLGADAVRIVRTSGR